MNYGGVYETSWELELDKAEYFKITDASNQ